MMLYPSIDRLLDHINSKYTLVTLSAKRAREIQEKDNQIMLTPESHKYVGKALEEINHGLLKVKSK